MPRGASPEREHEYKELVEEFKHEHRYPGREEEVAARIVNKQRAEHGETRAAEQAEHEGRSPDRGLPIPHYDHLDVDEIKAKLEGLDERDLEQLRDYEQGHRARKTMLEALDRRLEG